MRYISVHHSGGIGRNYFVSSQHLTAGHINNAHRARWNFKSSLGYFGGYNFVIEKNGKVTQHRAISEETAAQRGWNFNTISILLMGNFVTNVDKPTEEQIEAMLEIISQLLYKGLGADYKFAPNARLKLSPARVHPHRWFNRTVCYGTILTNDWARELALEKMEVELSFPKWWLYRFGDLIQYFARSRSLGGSSNCEDHARD